jgi:transposase
MHALRLNQPAHCTRIVPVDCHPDSFTATILEGRDAPSARVIRRSNKQPLANLEVWATHFTTPDDVFVIEASANTFAVADRLRAIGREVEILESHRAGKIGDAYCANDRIDSDKIGRIYLSGLAVGVWHADAKTRERRALLSAYQRCIKDCSRARIHLRSFLNEHSIRLPAGFRFCLPGALPRLLALKTWSPLEKLLLEEFHGTVLYTRQCRLRLRKLMALEIESDPDLLRLYKLAGLNLITTYSLIASIGDIQRFPNPKHLVSYFGLNPTVSDSGDFKGDPAIKPHGKGYVRAMLIQAARRLLTCQNPLQKWGLLVSLRRGTNRAAVAVARKLVVSVWHVMRGHWSVVEEANQTLIFKLNKLATELGVQTLHSLGFDSKSVFLERKLQVLRTYA